MGMETKQATLPNFFQVTRKGQFTIYTPSFSKGGRVYMTQTTRSGIPCRTNVSEEQFLALLAEADYVSE